MNVTNSITNYQHKKLIITKVIDEEHSQRHSIHSNNYTIKHPQIKCELCLSHQHKHNNLIRNKSVEYSIKQPSSYRKKDHFELQINNEEKYSKYATVSNDNCIYEGTNNNNNCIYKNDGGKINLSNYKYCKPHYKKQIAVTEIHNEDEETFPKRILKQSRQSMKNKREWNNKILKECKIIDYSYNISQDNITNIQNEINDNNNTYQDIISKLKSPQKLTQDDIVNYSHNNNILITSSDSGEFCLDNTNKSGIRLSSGIKNHSYLNNINNNSNNDYIIKHNNSIHPKSQNENTNLKECNKQHNEIYICDELTYKSENKNNTKYEYNNNIPEHSFIMNSTSLNAGKYFNNNNEYKPSKSNINYNTKQLLSSSFLLFNENKPIPPLNKDITKKKQNSFIQQPNQFKSSGDMFEWAIRYKNKPTDNNWNLNSFLNNNNQYKISKSKHTIKYSPSFIYPPNYLELVEDFIHINHKYH